MSHDSTERLLLAERQFSELANQLQKLKSAAQSIELAGKATSEMRELAESAVRTAGDLGDKIHEAAVIIEKQNIPQHLREKETRQNTKFQELMEQVASLSRSAEATAAHLRQIQSATNTGLMTLSQSLQSHAETTTTALSQSQAELGTLRRLVIAFALLQLGTMGAVLFLISKR